MSKGKPEKACLAICEGEAVARGLHFEEAEEPDDSWDAWLKWQGYDTSEVSAWDDDCWEEYRKWRQELAEETEKQNEQNDESPREDLVAEDEKHEELCAEEDASDVLSAQEEHARKKQEACEKGKGEGGCETEPARPVATPVRAQCKRTPGCPILASHGAG